MKRTGVARTPLRRGEKLQEKIEAQLAAIKRLPQLVRSFFKAPSVAYITDRSVNILEQYCPVNLRGIGKKANSGAGLRVTRDVSDLNWKGPLGLARISQTM
jgi:hypothetical protein